MISEFLREQNTFLRETNWDRAHILYFPSRKQNHARYRYVVISILTPPVWYLPLSKIVLNGKYHMDVWNAVPPFQVFIYHNSIEIFYIGKNPKPYKQGLLSLISSENLYFQMKVRWVKTNLGPRDSIYSRKCNYGNLAPFTLTFTLLKRQISKATHSFVTS